MIRKQFIPALGRATAPLVEAEFLTLYPALALALLWFGPRGALITGLAGVPMAVLARARAARADARPAAGDAAGRRPPRHLVTAALDRAFASQEETGKASACIVVGLDDPTHSSRPTGRRPATARWTGSANGSLPF